MAISDLKFQEILEERPQNLLFAAEEQLKVAADDEGQSQECRATCLAELAARWAINGNPGLGEWLGARLDFWRDFRDWHSVNMWPSERRLPENAGGWRNGPGKIDCEAVLRVRMRRLFAVDGFVAVYDAADARGGGAWFLPFELVDRNPGGAAMQWEDGTAMEEWSAAAETVLGGGKAARLLLLPEEGVGFGGESLMLALQAAVWRKEEDFPKYDPLRVAATGILRNGKLESVATGRKLAAFKETFGKDAALVGPRTGEIAEGERNYLAFDCGADLDEMRGRLKREFERKGLAEINWRYARKRMTELRCDVNLTNLNRWGELAELLEKMALRLEGRDENAHLECRMLHAVALCHAGRTEEARCANSAAYEIARGLGREGAMMRLQAGAMVVAQDSGEIAEGLAIGSGLEQRLEEYAGDDAEDLRMRCSGTLMQLHAAGNLWGVEGCSREKALEYAQAALSAARGIANSLPDDAEEEILEDSEANVAQDLNYCHLWHALFDPESDGEKKAHAAAERQLDELGGQARAKNRNFLLRQKSLALLNRWKICGISASAEEVESARIKDERADGWLKAANCRHLGVLWAVAGERERAIETFRTGMEAFPEDECSSAVLGSIRLSLLVHAALALGGDERGEMLAEAEALQKKFGGGAFFKVVGTERWLEMLRRGADARDFPVFYY